MDIRTFGDLKNFLNTLNDEQLAQNAIVINAPEESYIRIAEAEISETTWFRNEDTDGIMPIEEYDPEHYDGIPLSNEEYNTIIPPGRVFLYEEDTIQPVRSVPL